MNDINCLLSKKVDYIFLKLFTLLNFAPPLNISWLRHCVHINECTMKKLAKSKKLIQMKNKNQVKR